MYYEKENYDTFEKTMILLKKLWIFDLLWKKTMVLWKKIWSDSKLYLTIVTIVYNCIFW